ncbi:MAG: hypothetical protein DMF64_06965 [Acidobacteria bacterium]|nr:MAG: hypothetical protein DMF64_06965 [Acidobacteriota bacterium]
MHEITPEFYCDVFDQLEREQVRYVVVGGIAVILHGYVRPIADLDIVVAAAPEEANRTLHTLMRAGFMPTIPLPLHTLTVMRLFDHARRELDVFVRYLIPFDELWAQSESMRVGDSTVRVMSLEHLLREKRLNGRPRDLQDIEELLAIKGRDSRPSN